MSDLVAVDFPCYDYRGITSYRFDQDYAGKPFPAMNQRISYNRMFICRVFTSGTNSCLQQRNDTVWTDTHSLNQKSTSK